MEIGHRLPVYMDGRLLTEKLNWPMLTEFGATPAEWRIGHYRATRSRPWLAERRKILAHRTNRHRPWRIYERIR